MSRLLNCLFLGTVLTIMTGKSLGDEAPHGPAARIDPLPSGAVSRFGTSRFQNLGRVFSVAFSPDGKSLAVGSWDGTLRLWEVGSGKELPKLDKQEAPIRALAFSPDGTMLAWGEGSRIVLWQTRTAKELRRLAGHKGGITCLMFSPDGKLLASKAQDQTLRLWDVVTGRELRRLGGQLNEADSPVVFAPDGKTAASACLAEGEGVVPDSLQRTFRVWDVTTGTQIKSFKGNRSSRRVAAFSPDGKLLAVATGGPGEFRQRICLWDMDSGKELCPIEGVHEERPEPVSFLAFSPDGKTLASSGAGPIQLWDVATRREACRFQAHDLGQTPLAFSPDGRLLASGSTDIAVLLWDVTGRRQGAKLRPAQLSPQDFLTLWADLGGDDAPNARRALWALVAAGQQSVVFLRERLQPATTPVSAETIARLVSDLDSNQPSVRKKATAQLTELGELAERALLDARKEHPSLKLHRRIDEVLNPVLDQRTRPSGDRLRMLRAVEVLEQVGTPEARQLLEMLARGAPGALLTREAHASLSRWR